MRQLCIYHGRRRRWVFIGLLRVDESVGGFTHGKAPPFDLPTCTLLRKLAFEGLVHLEPVTPILGVAQEIGAVGRPKQICRRKIHTIALREIKHVYLSAVFNHLLDNGQKAIKDQVTGCRLQVLGTLKIGFGIDIRDHAFLHRVWLVV